MCMETTIPLIMIPRGRGHLGPPAGFSKRIQAWLRLKLESNESLTRA